MTTKRYGLSSCCDVSLWDVEVQGWTSFLCICVLEDLCNKLQKGGCYNNIGKAVLEDIKPCKRFFLYAALAQVKSGDRLEFISIGTIPNCYLV